MERDYSVQVLEHPEFGELRVFWRWVASSPWSWRIEPFAVEFDLFTPDSEKVLLREMIESLRMDRSLA